jgi:hypothetical protein
LLVEALYVVVDDRAHRDQGLALDLVELLLELG